MKNEHKGKVVLNDVRIAFADIYTAKAFNEGEPRFSATFILPPTHPQLKDIRAAITAVAEDKWAEKAGLMLKELARKDNLAYRTTEYANASGEVYSGFEGAHWLRATSKQTARPLLLSRRREVVTEQDGLIYAGCYVNTVVELWAQDNKWGKRVNATLKSIQFLRDGDAFGGGGTKANADDFADLGDGDTTLGGGEENQDSPW